MKTLILNGSPRKNGDTASLISIITQNIEGNYRIVDAYRCNISPCLDCRYCRQNSGCIINNEMQEIYGYIQECDNILSASPLYFSELTGKLLEVGSRLQTYFCAETLLKANYENCIRIPMRPDFRSLNLSNAVAVAAFEAMRQLGFPDMEFTGHLTGRKEFIL